MTAAILLALLPIVLIIGLGQVLRRRRFLAEAFWPQAERLGYYILLPCLFFNGLATADLGAIPVARLAATLVISTSLTALAVVMLRPAFRVDGPAFTSVFQASIRFNNYVGVTLATGLFGPIGLALAALCNAALVPTVNILSVLVFARFATARLTLRSVLLQLLRNPLLMASLAGICFQLFGLSVPAGIEPALHTLGAASLPLGLLCVGAALDFDKARQWIGPVAASSAIKFLALPLITLIVARLIGLEGLALTTALLFQALPTASSAYILARQLGGDAPLMAGLTAAQTVLALIALPLVMTLLALLAGFAS
ncbi:AEC family transporter [Pseudooceanicola algae]|uniref:Uncharacterized protein n=1 Tax=Pseudooceanicola algae TaxID=1537215 RepID=A0A418SF34_9RHOB|nr:AEC family transporter [Pseudooceanicola algae]QPM89306.1 hypothetical protein PSAL_005210 [Pseudooceanicola algae]